MRATHTQSTRMTTVTEFTWEDIQKILVVHLDPAGWERNTVLSFEYKIVPTNKLIVSVMHTRTVNTSSSEAEDKEKQARFNLQLLEPFRNTDEYIAWEVYERLQNLGWLWSGIQARWVDTKPIKDEEPTETICEDVGDNSKLMMIIGRELWQKIMAGDSGAFYSSSNLSDEYICEFLNKRGRYWSDLERKWVQRVTDGSKLLRVAIK